MSLVVEDGTGVSNANAFVEVADMDEYAASNNLSGWLDGEGDAEASIIRATTVLSNSFKWKGVRTYGRSQGLAWPRIGVTDLEDLDVVSDEIPAEIIQATYELAAYERANPGGLTPTYSADAQLRRETIGPITFEYAGIVNDPKHVVPVLTVVVDIVAGLLDQVVSGNETTGYAYRV